MRWDRIYWTAYLGLTWLAVSYVPPLDRRRGARNEGPVTSGPFPRGHCRTA
jgi:hypothetical protein